MTIHHKTLRRERERKGLSRKELARRCRQPGSGISVSVRTLGRYEAGETTPNDKLARRIAEVLDVSLEVLARPPEREGESKLREMGYLWVRIPIQPETRRQLGLVEDIYGVRLLELVDAAPWMFTFLAEMSLADRRSRLARAEVSFAEAIDQLPNCAFQGLVPESDFEEGCAWEKTSIRNRDVFGRGLSGAARERLRISDPCLNPFVDFLQRTARELDCSEVDADYCESMAGDDGLPDWRIFENLLEQITCEAYWKEKGDRDWARFAIDEGYVRLRDIDPDLMEDERAIERAEWLAGKVPAEAREAEERKMAALEGIL